MRIVKGTEVIQIQHPVILLYGQPGVCKSSLGFSAKNPLTLDADRGAHRAINRRDALVVDTWEDIAALNADVLAPYSTIVPDTVGRVLDFIEADIKENDPKKFYSGALNLQGWGVLKSRVRGQATQIRMYGKDLLMIAHDKEDKDGDTRIVRPDIQGGSYAEVMKIADCVGYCYMRGKDRILDFSPSDRWVGKNPGQW